MKKSAPFLVYLWVGLEIGDVIPDGHPRTFARCSHKKYLHPCQSFTLSMGIQLRAKDWVDTRIRLKSTCSMEQCSRTDISVLISSYVLPACCSCFSLLLLQRRCSSSEISLTDLFQVLHLSLLSEVQKNHSPACPPWTQVHPYITENFNWRAIHF